MAVSRKGRYAFTGKVGNSVVYLLNGQWVQRSIGVNTKPPTISQLACRQRTIVSNQLLSPVKEFINLGFKERAIAERKSAHNMASSYNRLHAITGNYPEQHIDYAKVLFTEGKKPMTTGATAKLHPLGLEFTWQVDPDAKGIRWNDQAMLMAYMPKENDAIFLVNAARRKEGKDILKLPRPEGPVIIETYLSFIAADHLSVSNSIYTGQFLWQ